MRVIVTGSRTWPLADAAKVWGVLWRLYASGNPNPFVIVHGGGNGVDTYASMWAKVVGAFFSIKEEVHPALWDHYGTFAGPRRNKEMVELGADLCLAFLHEPDGVPSKGTRSMMKFAEDNQIPVQVTFWQADLYAP